MPPGQNHPKLSGSLGNARPFENPPAHTKGKYTPSGFILTFGISRSPGNARPFENPPTLYRA